MKLAAISDMLSIAAIRDAFLKTKRNQLGIAVLKVGISTLGQMRGGLPVPRIQDPGGTVPPATISTSHPIV
jgi:hypothetical protein